MPWNPDVYNDFKAIRFKPFYDLMNLISAENLNNGADIGCGTGEQTAILSEKFDHARFLGIDTSAEMLGRSVPFKRERLQFKVKSIEAFAATASKWDLIFSNAALQWSEQQHMSLFPQLIAKLNHNGQFAVQMPFQQENILNKLLLELVSEQPFAAWLNGFVRHSPVLQVDEYTQILFDSGLKDLDISLKVYPIIAADAAGLYHFISGSALIPYMEKLDAAQQEAFKAAFLERIQDHFVRFPAIYAFKRILLYGVKV